MFPPKDQLTICFAHVAYQLQQRFLALILASTASRRATARHWSAASMRRTCW